MMPILLVSDNQRQIHTYITDFVKKHAIIPSSIFHYKKNTTVISIEQVREIQSYLVRATSMKYLFIIHDFETARKETQNAFLKTLEEKGENAYFIVIVSSIGSLLPTVISRCTIKKLKIKNVPQSGSQTTPYAGISFSGKKLKITQKLKVALSEEDTLFTQSLSQLFVRYTVTDREKAVRLCDMFLTTLHETMKKPQKSNIFLIYVLPKILKEILKTRNFMLKNNVNVQIAIDHILFEMKKIPVDK